MGVDLVRHQPRASRGRAAPRRLTGWPPRCSPGMRRWSWRARRSTSAMSPDRHGCPADQPTPLVAATQRAVAGADSRFAGVSARTRRSRPTRPATSSSRRG